MQFFTVKPQKISSKLKDFSSKLKDFSPKLKISGNVLYLLSQNRWKKPELICYGVFSLSV